MIFVPPRRAATIRTRWNLEQIREQIGAIAQAERPEGMEAFLAHGYFMGGRVGTRDFHLDYHYKAHKNPQTYDVHGAIVETPDWRIVRLKLRAHSPWIDPWVLAFLVGFAAFVVVVRGRSPGVALATVAIVLTVYALANLLYIPDAVTTRVSGLLASELRGSVQQGPNWVVPRE